jgi:hypothetical protein
MVGIGISVFLLVFLFYPACVRMALFDYYTYDFLRSEIGLSGLTVDQLNFYNQTIEEMNEYLHFPESERIRLKHLAKEMFEFGYDNYMKHAYPLDELDPIHCTGRGPDYAHPENININDVLGDYMLTLVDSLDTLAILGNASEYKKAIRLVIENLNFNKNITVQVFEATIRYYIIINFISKFQTTCP